MVVVRGKQRVDNSRQKGDKHEGNNKELGHSGVGVDRAGGVELDRPCIVVVFGGQGRPDLYKLQGDRRQQRV